VIETLISKTPSLALLSVVEITPLEELKAKGDFGKTGETC
jgi:hypothetical protein